MAWVDDLRAVMPPPDAVPAEAHDWPAVEAAIGLPVPPAYKEFCRVWGSGGLIGQEVFVLGPTFPGGPDLASEARLFQEDYAELQLNSPDKYRLPTQPRPGSMLPFGRDHNGTWYGWIVGTDQPDGWQVAILAHGDGMPEQTGLDFGAFMLALAGGTLRSAALHPDFLARPKAFEPMEPQSADSD